jgi:DNA invertase Pin-like site-specific DNA recombinase
MVTHKKALDAPERERPDFTGRLVGYARVSTEDQDLSMQIAVLRRAGVHDDNIWSEHVSGVKAKRPQRDMAILDARPGDVFVVYKLDRLGRSFRELLEITDRLQEKGIGFRSLTEGFDTTKPAGRLLFHVIAALAEFERGLIAERTRDGMAEARRRGVKLGAKRWFTSERAMEFERRYIAGESVKEITDSWGKCSNMVRKDYPKAKLKRLRRKRQQ